MELAIVILLGLACAGFGNWWLVRQDLKYYQKLVHRDGESND